jgi:hypothetical protein
MKSHHLLSIFIILLSIASCKKPKQEGAPSSESIQIKKKVSTKGPSKVSTTKNLKTPLKATVDGVVIPSINLKMAKELKNLLGKTPNVYIAANDVTWLKELMVYGRDWGEPKVKTQMTVALANLKGVTQVLLAFPKFPGRNPSTSGLILLKGDLENHPLLTSSPFPPAAFLVKSKNLILVAMGDWTDKIKKSKSVFKSGDLSSVLSKGECSFALKGMAGQAPFDNLVITTNVKNGFSAKFNASFTNALVVGMAKTMTKKVYEKINSGLPRIKRFLSPLKLKYGSKSVSGSVSLDKLQLKEVMLIRDIASAVACMVPDTPFEICKKFKGGPLKGKVDLKGLNTTLNTLTKKLSKEFGFKGNDFLLADIRKLASDPIFSRLQKLKAPDQDTRCGKSIFAWPSVGLVVADVIDNPKSLYGVIQTPVAAGFSKSCFGQFLKGKTPTPMGKTMVYENKKSSKLISIENRWLMSFGKLAGLVEPGKNKAGIGNLTPLLGGKTVVFLAKRVKELQLSNAKLMATYKGDITFAARADFKGDYSTEFHALIKRAILLLRSQNRLKGLWENINADSKGTRLKLSGTIPKIYTEKVLLLAEILILSYDMGLIN